MKANGRETSKIATAATGIEDAKGEFEEFPKRSTLRKSGGSRARRTAKLSNPPKAETAERSCLEMKGKAKGLPDVTLGCVDNQ